MKRKMKRKILAFLTAAAVGGTVLAGCSSGAEDSTSVRLEAESSSAGSSVSSNGLEVHIGDQPSFFILKKHLVNPPSTSISPCQFFPI